MEDNGEIFHSGSNTTMKKVLYIIKTTLWYYSQSIVLLFLLFYLHPEWTYPYNILCLALMIFTIPFFCEYALIPKLKKKFGDDSNDT